MLWIALLAALQEPSRWDFKPGSWVEMAWGHVRAPSSDLRVERTEIPADPKAPKPFFDGLKVVARRAERWQDRACEVTEYRDETRVATAWTVDGLRIPARESYLGEALPPNVVRAIVVEKKGERVRAWRFDAVDLEAKVDAAGRTFTCVVEQEATRHEMPTSTIMKTRRRWLSAEVPGHVVRQERQCTNDPLAEPHVYTSRDELKAFHVAR